MQTCDLFVNLNLGKDHLWGEGCPRTIIESMAAGCVNLSFDLIGNREIVIPGYNALIVGEKTPYALAEKIDELLSDRVRLEAIRDRARDVLIASHGLEKRWTAVRDFLRI